MRSTSRLPLCGRRLPSMRKLKYLPWRTSATPLYPSWSTRLNGFALWIQDAFLHRNVNVSFMDSSIIQRGRQAMTSANGFRAAILTVEEGRGSFGLGAADRNPPSALIVMRIDSCS